MRYALLVCLAACAPKTAPAPAPAPAPTPAAAPAAAPAPAAPAEALAPRLFDAAALRDGFALGTKLRLRMEADGRAVEERWEVVGHTADGCTIASSAYDPDTGALLEDQGQGTSTWTELESHASFPASRTAVADDTITVPAGTFETRRYTVSEPDGAVAVYHFAKTLPGPPVSLVITQGGATVRSMVLLERTSPAAP